jgi:hypothetical protein
VTEYQAAWLMVGALLVACGIVLWVVPEEPRP